MTTCAGTKGDGTPCGATAFIGSDGYCPAHAEGAAEEMSRRGQLGAEATRERWSRPGVSEEELGELESAEDVMRWLRIIAAAVTSGRLDKGDAQAATKAIDTWLKANDSLTEGDMQRLAEKLEALKSTKQKPALRSIP